MGEEAVLTYFAVLSWHSPGNTVKSLNNDIHYPSQGTQVRFVSTEPTYSLHMYV